MPRDLRPDVLDWLIGYAGHSASGGAALALLDDPDLDQLVGLGWVTRDTRGIPWLTERGIDVVRSEPEPHARVAAARAALTELRTVADHLGVEGLHDAVNAMHAALEGDRSDVEAATR